MQSLAVGPHPAVPPALQDFTCLNQALATASFNTLQSTTNVVLCKAAGPLGPSQPSANTAAMVPAKPHLNSAWLRSAILLARLSVLLAEVGRRSMQFAFLEFTGGVTKQIQWQAVSHREFILLGFCSLLSNLASLISIKASS